ncbi:MAG TPA: S9 family peptidase, partial [Casimicrobiaceae bacterium]|nr:S9 family peptidase [Casimicrobiaceae bacterium]
MHRPLAAAAALAFALDAAAATFAGVEVPPPLPPKPVVDTHWGVRVEDPYRFLETTSDPDVQAWMKVQATATEQILAKLPGREPLLARIREIEAEIPAVVSEVHRDPRGRLTYLRRGAQESQFRLVRRDTADGAERVLVDPEALAKATGKPHAIGDFSVSPDGALVAYSLSASGAEIGTLHVIDAGTGKEVTTPIDRIRGGDALWLPDGSGFFYARLAPDWQARPRAERFMDHRTYLHRLGASGDDPVVFGPGVHADVPLSRSDTGAVFAIPGHDHAFALVFHGVQRERSLYRAPLADVLAGKARWRKVFDASAGVQGVGWGGRWLYLRSAADAPRFQLLRLPLDAPDLAKATVVVPQGDGVLTGFAPARDGVYVTQRDGVVEKLALLSHDARPGLAAIPLPVEGSAGLAFADPRADGAIVTLAGWTRATKHFVVDGRGPARPLGLVPAGRFDAPEGIASREVKVRSHDGVEVPASIIFAKDTKLDGRNPLLLYGYGAYGN